MNLAIKNASGMLENIIAVRYFKFNGVNYLIFTKNEVDEAGYQKLYISKINNMVGNTISDEVEWNLLRDTIKVIAKANKENNILPVQDLNENEVNGIQIIGQKPFKLTSTSVSLLGANKNVANISVQTVEPSVPVVGDLEVNNGTNVVDSTSTIVPELSIASGLNSLNANAGLMNVENIQTLQQPNVNDVVAPVDANLGNFIEASTDAVPSPSSESSLPTVEFQPMNQTLSNVEAPTMNVSGAESAAVQSTNLFEIPSYEKPVVTSASYSENTVDYKKMYEEQTLKLNSLTSELEKYKEIIEQLKNILQ